MLSPARPGGRRVKPHWRSTFCGFLWPYQPGYSGGEIRDFHLLRHLVTISDVEYQGG